jgi:ubiquinone/menaquinone biosynthesis C-methylase UbiE
MEAKLQRRIQRYGWDRAAPIYEDAWQAQLAPAQVALLAMAAPRPGERVLDVACGTGLVTLPAARAVGSAGYALGTDISGAMVDAAAARGAAEGIENARFARMDGETLDLENDSFDLALCSLGLMYMPDPEAALGEMARVLRPGGRAAVAVWGERRHCGWAELFPIVDRKVASEVCPLFFQLGTGDLLGCALERAGLTRIQTRRIKAQLHFASDHEAVTAAFDGGAVALAVARFDQATYAAASAEYLASIAPYRQGGGYAIPGEFVIAAGYRGTRDS